MSWAHARCMANAYERVKTEWAIACRRDRHARLAASWAQHEPALAGIDSLEDALARCHDQTRPASAQAALSALLAVAGDDSVARLAVVRAMLPVLAGLAARGRHLGRTGCPRRDMRSKRQVGSSWAWPGPWDDLDDFDDEVVVLAFVQVGRLAGQRLAWPATAVLSRVDRQLRTHEAAFRRRTKNESLSADNVNDVDLEAVDQRSGLELILQEIRVAHSGGVVSAREARIVAADRVFGWATAEIAAAEGATVAAVRRARSRALHKLRLAMIELEPMGPAACAG
jgi:hypothetical protein